MSAIIGTRGCSGRSRGSDVGEPVRPPSTARRRWSRWPVWTTPSSPVLRHRLPSILPQPARALSMVGTRTYTAGMKAAEQSLFTPGTGAIPPTLAGREQEQMLLNRMPHASGRRRLAIARRGADRAAWQRQDGAASLVRGCLPQGSRGRGAYRARPGAHRAGPAQRLAARHRPLLRLPPAPLRSA